MKKIIKWIRRKYWNRIFRITLKGLDAWRDAFGNYEFARYERKQFWRAIEEGDNKTVNRLLALRHTKKRTIQAKAILHKKNLLKRIIEGR